MTEKKNVAVVAGHICLDIIPEFRQKVERLDHLLVPGKLVDVGPAVISTGGAVSNTGIALHRLGVPVRLMGKVGNDAFGQTLLQVLRQYGPALADGMIVDEASASSYTVVLNPPGVDRTFLHCPGANDTFGAGDIPYDELADVGLFHFGYPPLMRRMYMEKGRELAALLRRVKENGTVTSLDMALPDPASEAGKQDWCAILAAVLPNVDIFLPSFDEILIMLRARLSEHEWKGARSPRNKGHILSVLSRHLLDMGTSVVVLKLGDEGLYVRTTEDTSKMDRLRTTLSISSGNWASREFLVPCYKVDVVGTTGAGDATIAGFLAGLLKGLDIVGSARAAVGTGACNVEQADATSGVTSWENLDARIRQGWAQVPVSEPGPDWKWDKNQAIWLGPAEVR